MSTKQPKFLWRTRESYPCYHQILLLNKSSRCLIKVFAVPLMLIRNLLAKNRCFAQTVQADLEFYNSHPH